MVGGGGGGVGGGRGGAAGKALSKLWPSIVVSGLTPDPTPTSPISSVSDFLLLVCPLALQASGLFQREGWGRTGQGQMQQMSDVKLFVGMVASNPTVHHGYPPGAVVVNTPQERANVGAVPCSRPSPFLQSSGTLKKASKWTAVSLFERCNLQLHQ